jgi:hypothetical protein
MTQKKGQDELAAKIAKVLTELDGEPDPYNFTPDEVEKLQAVIAFVDKLKALRWFGKWMMWAVVAAGTVIVNWERIRLLFTGPGGSQ